MKVLNIDTIRNIMASLHAMLLAESEVPPHMIGALAVKFEGGDEADSHVQLEKFTGISGDDEMEFSYSWSVHFSLFQELVTEMVKDGYQIVPFGVTGNLDVRREFVTPYLEWMGDAHFSSLAGGVVMGKMAAEEAMLCWGRGGDGSDPIHQVVMQLDPALSNYALEKLLDEG